MVKKTKFPNPAPHNFISPATGCPGFMGVRWNLNFVKAGFRLRRSRSRTRNRSHKSAYDLGKSKIRVVRGVIGSTESQWELIRTFPFSSDSASFRLCENQIVGVGSKRDCKICSKLRFLKRFKIKMTLLLSVMLCV